ncbi:MAG: lysophospholipid acyltransferase family protein [Gemmatimonadaceae bacterium]
MSEAPERPVDAAAAERAVRKERKLQRTERLVSLVIGLLAPTWRFSYVHADRLPWHASPPRPFIFSMWHGELLPIIWAHRAKGIVGMVSEHGDGEVLSRIVSRWGYRLVRGSTSRGAGRVLLAFVRELRSGAVGMLTPDGPRGPAGVPQAGALLAAKQSGAPIVPVRCEASRAWRLGSWDRFLIPKPFARLRITYGEPWLPEGTDASALDELARRMGPS